MEELAGKRERKWERYSGVARVMFVGVMMGREEEKEGYNTYRINL
jgi:hypothetical protein